MLYINYECAEVCVVTHRLDKPKVLNNLVSKQRHSQENRASKAAVEMKRLSKFLPLKRMMMMMMMMMTLRFVMTMKLITDMCRLQRHR